MRQYIIYNTLGKILRTGVCSDTDFEKQVGAEEFVIEGKANDAIQKIVNNKIVNKTQAEIDADSPSPVPLEQQPAYITNAQWQKVLSRLSRLENE